MFKYKYILFAISIIFLFSFGFADIQTLYPLDATSIGTNYYYSYQKDSITYVFPVEYNDPFIFDKYSKTKGIPEQYANLNKTAGKTMTIDVAGKDLNIYTIRKIDDSKIITGFKYDNKITQAELDIGTNYLLIIGNNYYRFSANIQDIVEYQVFVFFNNQNDTPKLQPIYGIHKIDVKKIKPYNTQRSDILIQYGSTAKIQTTISCNKIDSIPNNYESLITVSPTMSSLDLYHENSELGYKLKYNTTNGFVIESNINTPIQTMNLNLVNKSKTIYDCNLPTKDAYSELNRIFVLNPDKSYTIYWKCSGACIKPPKVCDLVELPQECLIKDSKTCVSEYLESKIFTKDKISYTTYIDDTIDPRICIAYTDLVKKTGRNIFVPYSTCYSQEYDLKEKYLKCDIKVEDKDATIYMKYDNSLTTTTNASITGTNPNPNSKLKTYITSSNNNSATTVTNTKDDFWKRFFTTMYKSIFEGKQLKDITTTTTTPIKTADEKYVEYATNCPHTGLGNNELIYIPDTSKKDYDVIFYFHGQESNVAKNNFLKDYATQNKLIENAKNMNTIIVLLSGELNKNNYRNWMINNTFDCFYTEARNKISGENITITKIHLAGHSAGVYAILNIVNNWNNSMAINNITLLDGCYGNWCSDIINKDKFTGLNIMLGNNSKETNFTNNNTKIKILNTELDHYATINCINTTNCAS